MKIARAAWPFGMLILVATGVLIVISQAMRSVGADVPWIALGGHAAGELFALLVVSALTARAEGREAFEDGARKPPAIEVFGYALAAVLALATAAIAAGLAMEADRPLRAEQLSATLPDLAAVLSWLPDHLWSPARYAAMLALALLLGLLLAWFGAKRIADGASAEARSVVTALFVAVPLYVASRLLLSDVGDAGAATLAAIGPLQALLLLLLVGAALPLALLGARRRWRAIFARPGRVVTDDAGLALGIVLLAAGAGALAALIAWQFGAAAAVLLAALEAGLAAAWGLAMRAPLLPLAIIAGLAALLALLLRRDVRSALAAAWQRSFGSEGDAAPREREDDAVGCALPLLAILLLLLGALAVALAWHALSPGSGGRPSSKTAPAPAPTSAPNPLPSPPASPRYRFSQANLVCERLFWKLASARNFETDLDSCATVAQGEGVDAFVVVGRASWNRFGVAREDLRALTRARVTADALRNRNPALTLWILNLGMDRQRPASPQQRPIQLVAVRIVPGGSDARSFEEQLGAWVKSALQIAPGRACSLHLTRPDGGLEAKRQMTCG